MHIIYIVNHYKLLLCTNPHLLHLHGGVTGVCVARAITQGKGLPGLHLVSHKIGIENLKMPSWYFLVQRSIHPFEFSIPLVLSGKSDWQISPSLSYFLVQRSIQSRQNTCNLQEQCHLFTSCRCLGRRFPPVCMSKNICRREGNEAGFALGKT